MTKCIMYLYALVLQACAHALCVYRGPEFDPGHSVTARFS